LKTSETPNSSFYNLCDARMEYEKVWTKKNYDVLTKCLSNLPITWRFYAKHRIFAEIEKWDPSDSQRLNGVAIEATYNKMLKEFPELERKKSN
jgi:N-methylhydantoinase B